MEIFFDRFRYVFAVFAFVSYPGTFLWWFVIHPFVSFWRKVGKKRSLWILGTLYVASMVALFPFRDAVLRHDYGSDWRTVLAALPLMALTMWIARQRKKYLTFSTLAGAPELEEDGKGGTLFTEGIYGKIRHPRYAEFIAGGFGWALIINWREIYLLQVMAVFLVYLVVLMEEKELRARFGAAYDAYADRVPRFVPRWPRA